MLVVVEGVEVVWEREERELGVLDELLLVRQCRLLAGGMTRRRQTSQSRRIRQNRTWCVYDWKMLQFQDYHYAGCVRMRREEQEEEEQETNGWMESCASVVVVFWVEVDTRVEAT